MHPDFQYCTNRAEEATAEADGAQLDNVRERALRSAAAWQAMADRASKIERERLARQRQRDAAPPAEGS